MGGRGSGAEGADSVVGVLLVLVVGGGPGRARVQQHWHVMDLWHIVACWGGTAWRRWATSHALTRAGAGWAGSLLCLSAGTKGWRQGLAFRAAVPAARTHALAAPHPTHPSSHPTRVSSHLRYAPLILSPTLCATHPPTHPPRCAAAAAERRGQGVPGLGAGEGHERGAGHVQLPAGEHRQQVRSLCVGVGRG